MGDVMSNFEQSLQYVKDEVGKLLSTSPLVIRTFTKHLLKSEGKYLRAAAVLSTAIDAHGEIHYDAVKFAASIEILHLATLVHDDVMDDADTRRGVATLHKKFGRKTAVICGDYLLAQALSVAQSVERKEEYLDYDLPKYMQEIALGELSQHINNGNHNLSTKDYLKIIEGKTAKLFEASFFAGAITSNEPQSSHEAYKSMGYDVGMIFQLLDDVMDFDETDKQAKKPVQSDYEQGVITLPLIHAFQAFPETRDEAKKVPLTRDVINRIVSKANGVGFTKEKAEVYYNNAVEALNTLQIDHMKKDRLMGIINLAMRR